MQPRGYNRAVVLLVEDDPGDQELTRRALRESELDVDLRVVSDGEEAMDYLLYRGRYTDRTCAPRPDLVLLDLNMPKLDGRQVLKRMKEAPDLRTIPVVVLTTSQQESDIVGSYDLGCSSLVTKPMEIDSFVECIRQLCAYWFGLVALPSSRGGS